MKNKDYKNEIIKIMQNLHKEMGSIDKKRNHEEDNDSFFFLTGKRRGLRIALNKLYILISKK